MATFFGKWVMVLSDGVAGIAVILFTGMGDRKASNGLYSPRFVVE